MALKRVVYSCNGDYIALIAVVAAAAAAVSRGGLPGIEPDYTIGLVCLFYTLNGAVT